MNTAFPLKSDGQNVPRDNRCALAHFSQRKYGRGHRASRQEQLLLHPNLTQQNGVNPLASLRPSAFSFRPYYRSRTIRPHKRRDVRTHGAMVRQLLETHRLSCIAGFVAQLLKLTGNFREAVREWAVYLFADMRLHVFLAHFGFLHLYNFLARSVVTK